MSDHRVLGGHLTALGKSPGFEVNPVPVCQMPHLGFAQTALALVTIGVAKG